MNIGRKPRPLLALVLAMLCAGLANAENPFAVVEYGGLTYGESTPADLKKVAGQFKGCAKDESLLGLKDATVCTVVVSTNSSAGPSNVSQQFVFENNVLREVTLTASEEETFKALDGKLSKRYLRIKPPVYLALSDGRRIFISTVEGRVATPRLIHRVEPSYPEAARKKHAEGEVIAEAVISAEGDVEKPQVVRSLIPLLDASAIDAIKQWKYEPGKLDGKPVAVPVTVTVKFSLHQSPRQ